MNHRKSLKQRLSRQRKSRYPALPSLSAIIVGLTLAISHQPLWASSDNQHVLEVADQQLSPTCYVQGLSDRLNCGFVTVPENPNKPDGKTIDVHYVVLPAVKNSYPGEALLAIAGGPGQSAIDNAASFNSMLAKVREQRDILLIDQRGTGRSNILNCTDGNASALSFNDSNVDSALETQKCLEQIKDTDITQYGSLTALADFEAVREHLGYKKLHLYGISYGTRMAQLYMRHYPDVLSTVTLDGVVPMQQSVLAIGEAIERGFSLLLEDCKATAACHAQFPQLADDLAKVEAKLQMAPFVSDIRDPLTGDQTSLTMTRNKFLGAVRMALYMPNVRALLPHAIHQAAEGNFQAMVGLFSLTVDSTGIAMGMHASVVCGEDVHRITPEMRETASHSYMGKLMLEQMENSCAVWQIPNVDANFSEPISSDIPTLLLSGEIDPATPPSWGELAKEKLTNAKHFVAPYATHGVAYQSCGNKLIADLVASGSVKDLDGQCLEKDVRRSFYLNASTVEPLTNDNNTSTPEPALNASATIKE